MTTASEYQPAHELGMASFVTWCVTAAVSCWAAAQPESPVAGVRGYVHIAAVVTTIVWTHRVYSNLSGLGFVDLRFSPTWAAAAYLIPIANLFIPYQVLSEVRIKTPTEDGSAPDTILLVWWIAYVVAYAAAMGMDVPETASVIRAVALAIVAVTCWPLVRSIDHGQRRRASVLASSDA